MTRDPINEIDQMYAEAAAEPYLDQHRPENQHVVDGVILDPTLRPSFERTDHYERDRQEIEDWWCRPYIQTATGEGMSGEALGQWRSRWPNGVRYDVRSLDGGAWDRSTFHGAYPTLAQAVAAAHALEDH